MRLLAFLALAVRFALHRRTPDAGGPGWPPDGDGRPSQQHGPVNASKGVTSAQNTTAEIAQQGRPGGSGGQSTNPTGDGTPGDGTPGDRTPGDGTPGDGIPPNIDPSQIPPPLTAADGPPQQTTPRLPRFEGENQGMSSALPPVTVSSTWTRSNDMRYVDAQGRIRYVLRSVQEGNRKSGSSSCC